MDKYKLPDLKFTAKKIKGANFKHLFGATNERWFELLHTFKSFGYKTKSSSSKYSECHKFYEIIDFKETVDPEIIKLCSWKFGFYVLTKQKKYNLFVDEKKLYEDICFAFKFILGRVKIEIEPINPAVFKLVLKIFKIPTREELRQLEIQKEKLRKEEEIKQLKLLEEKKKLQKEKEEEEKKKLQKEKIRQERLRQKN